MFTPSVKHSGSPSFPSSLIPQEPFMPWQPHFACRNTSAVVSISWLWIPPSQMSLFGSQQDSLPAGAVPYSQRILRSLPTPFLKAANSSFLSATSASITSSLPKSPRRAKRKSFGANGETPTLSGRETPDLPWPAAVTPLVPSTPAQ
jgi:hypothetical protein